MCNAGASDCSNVRHDGSVEWSVEATAVEKLREHSNYQHWLHVDHPLNDESAARGTSLRDTVQSNDKNVCRSSYQCSLVTKYRCCCVQVMVNSWWTDEWRTAQRSCFTLMSDFSVTQASYRALYCSVYVVGWGGGQIQCYTAYVVPGSAKSDALLCCHVCWSTGTIVCAY